MNSYSVQLYTCIPPVQILMYKIAVMLAVLNKIWQSPRRYRTLGKATMPHAVSHNFAHDRCRLCCLMTAMLFVQGSPPLPQSSAYNWYRLCYCDDCNAVCARPARAFAPAAA